LAQLQDEEDEPDPEHASQGVTSAIRSSATSRPCRSDAA
jgi:hypothetical protein